MKWTLLEIVQDVASAIRAQEVNDITATEEAEAITRIVRQCYYDITGITDLPEHYDFFELNATDTTTPVLMTLPSNVLTLGWVKYNNKLTSDTDNDYQMVEYVPMDTFLKMQETLSVDTTGVSTMVYTRGSDTIDIKYRNDKMPQMYTTFDDFHILFDSLDTGEDANLQKNKTQCYGLLDTTFSFTNTFVPDLDARQFNLLLQEAISTASLRIRQQADPKAEQKAKNHWINTQRVKQGIPNPMAEYERFVNFGRKPRGNSMISAMKRGN